MAPILALLLVLLAAAPGPAQTPALPPGAASEQALWEAAVAHGRAGEPRAALPYLERLVSLDPDDLNYRLELASVLGLLGRDDRAAFHFRAALAGTLPADTRQEILARIAALERADRWRGSLRASLVTETNPLNATAESRLRIGDLDFVLDPANRPKQATGLALGATLGRGVTLRPDLRLEVSATVDAELFGGAAPDDVTLGLQVALSRSFDREGRLSFGIGLSERWLGRTRGESGVEPYSSGVNATLIAGTGLTDRTHVELRFRHERLRHDTAIAADGTSTSLRVQARYRPQPRLQLRAAAETEVTDARSPVESGRRVTFFLGGDYAFEGGLVGSLDLSRGTDWRDAVPFFFGRLRDDTRTTATLRLVNRNWAIGDFAPVVEIGYEKQSSTIAIFSYENTRLGLGITRSF
ncbi:DUF560 domain-containing protein [Halovulum dunhuangense]|uniref:DUF560 domain-containing protein n=1 Tax=Halovulum dunhuangense TaxID=1505036 RepID=A0A849L785_9RHOB|nr:surface lipoprotein assembly modifier [Halovulum dunhuangense]NNU82004.1 DUF560 domain-containing protein [Halovulum dunhuangense]